MKTNQLKIRSLCLLQAGTATEGVRGPHVAAHPIGCPPAPPAVATFRLPWHFVKGRRPESSVTSPPAACGPVAWERSSGPFPVSAKLNLGCRQRGFVRIVACLSVSETVQGGGGAGLGLTHRLFSMEKNSVHT